MKNYNVRDIVSMVEGKLLCGDETKEIKDLAIDSRAVKEGDLFVPIIGEKVDAHRFIKDVINHCTAVLTQEHTEADPLMVQSQTAVIQVEDTLTAMQVIGKNIRKNHPVPVIGVTGSVGKTTTREMIYTALNVEKKVFQTVKNYNGQIGVPLTLAKMTGEEEMAVLEMGISEPGEMIKLADIIHPDMAVVTGIGEAHIEQLKTKDNICSEKLNIASFMKEEQVLFLNGDDPILMAHKGAVKQTIISFGFGENCDYRAVDVNVNENETTFVMEYKNKRQPVCLTVMGGHNVRNALVVLAVADYCGVSVEKAVAALKDFQGLRQQIKKTKFFTMIDDTYNASPDSMRAALKVLQDMSCKGKKIAVLADMLELGEETKTYHKEIGTFVNQCSVDYVIGYGDVIQNTEKELEIPFYHGETLEAVIAELERVGEKDDIILLKGSNTMKLSSVVKHFEEKQSAI